MKDLIAVDLFCGAGGLSCGLGQAGFNVVFASDIHPVYSTTYKLNHPQTTVFTEDIRTISDKELPDLIPVEPGKLDLLVGGPPCQGFSINAPIRSMDDHRNHLFLEFLRVANLFKPKYILIENVPGIISLDKGTVVHAIYHYLSQMGYRTKHMILFAAHYGIPQIRWRTFFIATRLKDCECTFPNPTHFAKGVANFTGAKHLCFHAEQSNNLFTPNLLQPVTVWDAISDLPFIENGGGADEMDYSGPAISHYQKILRGECQKLYNHRTSSLGKINLARLEFIPQGGSWRDIPVDLLPTGLRRAKRSDHTKRYGRLHPNGLCSTILTKCDPHWGAFFHPTQDRTLTVREAARIQSFPDKFKFLGSLTEQYEQVGNAVPPILAQAIGTIIADQLNSLKKDCSLAV